MSQARLRGRSWVTIGLAGLFLALAPGGAEATTKVTHYEGENGGTPPFVVGFDLVRRENGQRFVKRFYAWNLRWGCTNGVNGYTPWPLYYPGRMTVTDRKFEGAADESWANGDPNVIQPGPFSVTGKIKRNGTATGTVQRDFQITGMSGPSDCSSGAQSWVAARTPAP